MKRIYIFDIDGVLLDSSHRYRIKDNRKIDLDHWRRHCVESEIKKDQPLPFANIYKKLIKNPHAYVIIATAREMLKHDWEHIKQTLGLPDHFIYRPKGSNESGKAMKVKRLRKLFNLRQFKGKPVTVFEDNIEYLNAIASEFNAMPVYVHSKQGF